MNNTKMTTKLNFLALILLFALLALMLASCGKDEIVQGPQGIQGVPGERGEDGLDGETPHIGENGTWWIGDMDTGVVAEAQKGQDGYNGLDGKDGADGADGADGITPQFSFNSETNILSVSYDFGSTWNDMIDLNGMCQNGKDGTDGTDGTDGIDGITPLLMIDADTNFWMVSYDAGNTWESLGVYATGAKGEDGIDGVDGQPGTNGTPGKDGKDGKDAVTPTIRVESSTYTWQVSYDNGETWQDLGASAKGKDGADGATGQKGEDGKNGADGKTPVVFIEGTKLYVKYEGETTKTLLIDLSTLAGGSDGEDGVTPQIRINSENGMWEASYDDGLSWNSLGVKATGSDGKDGEDGVDGRSPTLSVEDNKLYVQYVEGEEPSFLFDFSGICNDSSGSDEATGDTCATPKFRVNDSNVLQVSYDDGTTYADLFDLSTLAGSDGSNGTNGTNGKDGKDGITPTFKTVGSVLGVSYDGGETYTDLLDFAEIIVNGTDGADGKDGEDGRGIADVEIVGGVVYVYYTDGTSERVGTVGDSESSGGSSDIYTDALDFYPINDGNEYAVAIGRATFLTKIIIPETYNGCPVTEIIKCGFTTGSEVEEIYLPSSIKRIGDEAFSGCENLTKINIPSSVEYVGVLAFAGVKGIYVEEEKSDKYNGWFEFVEEDYIHWGCL